MAVRFFADGQDYTNVTLGGGVQTMRSLCCWGKIAVDRNAFSTFLGLDDNASEDAALQTLADGTTLSWWESSGAGTVNAGPLTVGTWYFMAVALNGATGTIYWRALGAGSWSTAALSGSDASITANALRIGESGVGGEWLNGAVENVKLWLGAALSQAELDAEYALPSHVFPARTANLAGWYPLLHAGQTTAVTGHDAAGGEQKAG